MARTNIRGSQIADGANGVDLTVDVTGTLPAVNGGTGVTSIGALKTALSLTKSDVGLSNVDNTSDASKPVSTAQQAALDLKRDVTDDDIVFGGDVTTSSALNSLLTTAAASNKVVQLVPGQAIAVTTTVQVPEGTGLCCRTVPRWQHGASATGRPRLIAQTGFTGVVVDVATGSRGIILSGFEIDGASVAGVTHGLRFNASGSDVENSHYVGDIAVRRVVGTGISGRLRTSLLESVYVFECGTGVDIGGDGGWFDVHWIGGYVALCKNYGVRIRPNGSGVAAGFLQFINVRVERTGQIANDPKNDGSSADWVNTAPGWDITGAVLCAWTNCTTDANNGPGVQIAAPAASQGYKVANLLFTSCIFNRDGQNSGTAALSTAAAVSVAGLSSSGVDHVGPVRFENCVTMVGESADDGSSTYEAPAYGVVYDHVDFFGWTGTARGTTASHLAGSDLWQPRVDDPFAQINRTVSLAVTGGSPGSGKVLTSDASGNATWATPDVTQAELDAVVVDSIADSDTTHAPSRNAVFDALALKAPLASPTFTGTVETPAVKITTGAAAKKKFVSDASGNGSWVDDADGLQWWQTFTLHAVGVGQQDMGIWVPYDCTLTKIRYRCKTAGTGGSPLVELRKNGITGSETVSGTSFAPSTAPSWNTVSINFSADDLLYAYQTAINTTTVGVQLKVECLLVRR